MLFNLSKKNKKGCLITLEGGEGAGKSSLQRRLYNRLIQEGHEVVMTREPGGSPLSEKVRDLVLHKDESFKIGAKAELLLFLAARAQHIEELIAPAIESGKIVLCDRYNDSTVAYQGGARGLGVKYVQQLCAAVCGTAMPQLTLLLDIDPKIGLERSRNIDKEHAKKGELDRIESETLLFHEKIRSTLLELGKKEPLRFFCIDASESPEKVFQEAFLAIKELVLFSNGS